MKKRIISRFLDDLWWICFLVERSHPFLRKLLPSFGVSTSLGGNSRLVFRHPSHPSHGWAKWVLKSGWNRQDETNGTNGPSGFPHHRHFFSPYSKRVFCQTYTVDLLPKTLTRLFLNECVFFSLGDFQASQDPSRRKVSSKKRQNRGDARWVSTPFVLRRKDLRCHWVGASSRAPTFICMRAFDTTLFVEAISQFTVQCSKLLGISSSFGSLLKLCRV